MARFVYADNAATTPVSPTVFAAMKPFYTDLYGNPSSLYSVGREAKKHLELARADVAACLNAEQLGDQRDCPSACQKGEEAHHHIQI